jgi:hypothetical protein
MSKVECRRLAPQFPSRRHGLNINEATAAAGSRRMHNIFPFDVQKKKEKRKKMGGRAYGYPRPFVKGSIGCPHLWTFVMLQYEDCCSGRHRGKSSVHRDPYVSSRLGRQSRGLGFGTLKYGIEGCPNHPERHDHEFYAHKQWQIQRDCG